METLKINIEESVKNSKEVEITLPCYTKKSGMFYKITSEDNVIRVIPNFNEISQSHGLQFPFGAGYEVITKEEFEAQLKKVKKELGI